MSVCFFVPAAEQGQAAEEADQELAAEEVTPADASQQTLQQFWHNVLEDIKKVNAEDFKTQALPLARIKKIMKLDEEVKMISAEAPVMFAKAAEIFIHELTLRAWQHTEDNKRRTLQRNDIAMAISKSDQFDFLIDIVPRHEVKPAKPREDLPRPVTVVHNTEQVLMLEQRPEQQPSSGQPACQHTEQQPHPRFINTRFGHIICGALPSPSVANNKQVSQQHTATVGGSSQQFVIQQQQVVQPSTSTQQTSGVVQQPLIVQQLVTSSGEVQQLPIQLSQAQLNMIRLQVQNNPSQPIIIQAQPHAPQIIQVTSQAQHQQPQQVFLAQVSNNQDDS